MSMDKVKVDQWVKAFEMLGAVKYKGVEFRPAPFLAYFVDSAGINLAVPYQVESVGKVAHGNVPVNWRANIVQAYALLEASGVSYTAAVFKYQNGSRSYRLVVESSMPNMPYEVKGADLGDLVLKAIAYGNIKTIDTDALARALVDFGEQ
mgnify:CR=1 FL=1